MTKFKNNNHYTIFGWMIHRLGLKDAKLIVYAIVYNFSQDGENEFYGGRKYMAEASARSLPTIDRMLAELEKDGLIKKMERENDGVSRCRYSVFIDEDSGEGIVDPEKTKNSNDNTPYHDDNTPYHDDNTPPYHDDNTPYHDDNTPPYHDDNTPYHDDNTPYHDDNTPYHDDNTHNKYNINNNKYKYKENKDKSLLKKVQEGFVFEDDREANFIKWCNENIPNLMTKVKPLTYKQYISLNSEFTRDEILNKLLYMNSMKNFKRRFSDVHGVLLNWLRGDKDPNYTQRFRNKKNKVA